MTENQRIWARARDGLIQAVTELGFSAAMAEVIARELKSPKAIDRMTSWVRLAKPRSEEMLADEMLAIRAEIDAWREKKASLEAQSAYDTMRYRGEIGADEDDGE